MCSVASDTSGEVRVEQFLSEGGRDLSVDRICEVSDQAWCSDHMVTLANCCKAGAWDAPHTEKVCFVTIPDRKVSASPQAAMHECFSLQHMYAMTSKAEARASCCGFWNALLNSPAMSISTKGSGCAGSSLQLVTNPTITCILGCC